MIKIAVSGSTGSIGKQTLEVAAWHKEDIQVISLCAGSDWQTLAKQAIEFHPQMVAIADKSAYPQLSAALSKSGIRVAAGEEGLAEAVSLSEVDIVVAAISGVAGLSSLVTAIKAGKNIALANKESLVAAGELVMGLVQKYGVDLRPVDSEHSAIWQCLAGESNEEISSLILTASGGAFRNLPLEQLQYARPADALKHPNWRMGSKITIDCATMVNKGLEVIEAHWLFGVAYEKINVLIHPQSIIHSMVAFRDGSVKAQLGWPDMRLPIQYALFDRQRPTNPSPALDFLQVQKLEFLPPDEHRFPGLSIVREAGQRGGTAPTYINAANEELVHAFLAEKIGYTTITDTLYNLLDNISNHAVSSLEDIYAADAMGRSDVANILR